MNESKFLRVASKVASDVTRMRVGLARTGWGFGVNPGNFKPRDLVAVSGAYLGQDIFTLSGMGVVRSVDAKARKVSVDLFQNQRSRNHPMQFDPEDIMLVRRPRGQEDEIDTPVFSFPSFQEIVDKPEEIRGSDE